MLWSQWAATRPPHASSGAHCEVPVSTLTCGSADLRPVLYVIDVRATEVSLLRLYGVQKM
ncbi:hypothetical protein PITC_088960 [Penicillium italicum]|uniref:Uncharacterized protein n=1 Tax=Penicillium italicum TaxID=40296 RepID=A0A0A2L8Q3_PENIT|nr:hypothetical protein PITC_088960 [Penicillium italicum]